MRRLLFILFILTGAAQAQTVITIAGITDVAGNDDGSPFSATFNQPHGIAIDHNDNSVYIADRSNHVIRKILPSGEVTTFAGSGNIGSGDGQGVAASFHDPWDVDVDRNGNVYVADQKNNKIRKITPGGLVTTLAGSGNFGFTDATNGLAASFGNPSGVAVDDQGNVYVADHLNHLIRKVSPTGVVTTLAGSRANHPDNNGRADGTGSNATFYRPYGLTVAPNGNIYVADEWNFLIRRITPTGVVTTVAGSGNLGSNDGAADQSSFNYPWDVVVDSLDNVYVGDGFNHVIRKITPQGQVSTYIGIAGTTGAEDGTGEQASFNAPTGLAINFNENAIYITDSQNDLIRKIVSEELPVPSIFVSSNQVCEGEPLSFSVVPDEFDNYRYFVNGSLVSTSEEASIVIENTSSGVYDVVVEAVRGSSSRFSQAASYEVLAPTNFNLETNEIGQFCEGDTASVAVTAIPGSTYLWSSGDTTSTLNITESGQYFLTVTDERGCRALSDTLVYEFEAPPIVDFEATPQSPGLNEEVQFQNLTTGAQFYRWDFGDPRSGPENLSSEESPTHFYDSTGIYDVTLNAFSSAGCVSSVTKEGYILVNYQPYIPTAFTPNQDGMNDVFFVRGGSLTDFELAIYNQWGQRIFTSTDQDLGWDGAHRGEPVETGTFVYVLKATNSAGEAINLKGHVTILR